MDGSIGTALTDAVNRSVQNTLARAGRSSGPLAGGDTSFSSLLDAGLTHHAAMLGYTLPGTDATAAASSATGSTDHAVPETADAIWQRVKLADMAHNGLVDSIMDGLAKAAEERADRQHRSGSSTSGSGFDGLFD